MENPELITLLNTVLLSVVSMAALLVGFFLKDLYRDYKNQIEKVNALHRELDTHNKLFDELLQINQQQLNRLHERMNRLDGRHWP
ncbi:MAG: hypothetical protein WA958_20415 [Tunicatimonas sp.]|jgi:hypothetical protein